LARQQFEQVWIADSSTLEALFRKLDSLQDKRGERWLQMATVVDLVTRLPAIIWFEANPAPAILILKLTCSPF